MCMLLLRVLTGLDIILHNISISIRKAIRIIIFIYILCKNERSGASVAAEVEQLYSYFTQQIALKS